MCEKTVQAALSNDLTNPSLSNTKHSSKMNEKVTLFDSIQSNNTHVSEASEDEFDQFVCTSFDDSDDNDSNDNEILLQLKSTDDICIEEKKSKNRTMKNSQSMPILAEMGSLKPILKKSSFAKGFKRRKQSSDPLLKLKPVCEHTSMTEDESGSSLSSSETLTSTASKGCATINDAPLTMSRICSMPEISRNVSFKSVEIREYEVTLVDNPACRNGPPIGLSWNYLQGDTKDFFDYESVRSNNRRTVRQMIVPKNYRKEMLKAHSEEEIKQVKKEMKKIRSSRNYTIMFGGMFEVKESLENVGRSLKNKMNSKKNGKKLCSSSHI